MTRPGFTADPFRPRRRPTRVVEVGEVGVGGRNPIRIQSMTTTPTLDTRATADQVERLVRAGCEIVRITAPSLRDAENLGEIRRELRRRGLRVPLVADIHFTPRAAMIAAEHVEKVRINPGNYADKKRFAVREYSDAEYREELERVAERFRPLVRRLRELGRALRIGTNHGSLSDRILNRYGDTPEGMVESALEFLDVCEDEGYRDVIFSMKASNPVVAAQAYRLLAQRLAERSGGAPSYPFHLGVTEAGDGEDGRIKSAIGIGALLEDGIGDTLRVSLTEDPVREIPAARALAERYEAAWSASAGEGWGDPGAPFVSSPYRRARRPSRRLPVAGVALGGDEPVRAELDLGAVPGDVAAVAGALAAACRRLPAAGGPALEGLVVEAETARDLGDVVRFREALEGAGLPVPLAVAVPPELAEAAAAEADRVVLPARGGGAFAGAERLAAAAKAVHAAGRVLEWRLDPADPELPAALEGVLSLAGADSAAAVLVSLLPGRAVHAIRYVRARLDALGAGHVPLVLAATEAGCREEEAWLAPSVELGVPLLDGIGDAVRLAGFRDPGQALDRLYRILQGARQRSMRTEFISCPSCGRTLFDLETTTARIKARTGHLPGVKIAVMGCIVNGPGEMADADFGYVGSGPGTVNLYVGRTLVERHVPSAEAPDRLVALIEREGRWVDPPEPGDGSEPGAPAA